MEDVASNPDPLEIPSFSVTEAQDAKEKRVTLIQDGLKVEIVRGTSGNVELVVNEGDNHFAQRQDLDPGRYSLMFVKRKQVRDIFPLMQLPGELRAMIYDLVIGSPQDTLYMTKDWPGHGQNAIAKYVESRILGWEHPWSPISNVLLVRNKQLRFEFASRLFRAQRFHFDDMNRTSRFLGQCGDFRAYISKLHIHWWRPGKDERAADDPEQLSRDIVACTGLKTLRIVFRARDSTVKTLRGFFKHFPELELLLQVRGLEQLDMIRKNCRRAEWPVPPSILDHFKAAMFQPKPEESRSQKSLIAPQHSQEKKLISQSPSRQGQTGEIHNTAASMPAPTVLPMMPSHQLDVDHQLQAHSQAQNFSYGHFATQIPDVAPPQVEHTNPFTDSLPYPDFDFGMATGASPDLWQQSTTALSAHGYSNSGTNNYAGMLPQQGYGVANTNGMEDTFDTTSGNPNTGVIESQHAPPSDLQTYNTTPTSALQQTSSQSLQSGEEQDLWDGFLNMTWD
ncbi:hypothetical protein K490DRAFT_67433 [Saccharata proteae CBS 121410]|uniref:Uncharacterized protein n=1 Tax=Saccharata proteae CBS 121410 TaxID=1314787 RepID=A0A9P4LVC4_9PEZI|nr:hypothetical protein K490DRAFT_67433 [Saccharata proteae CBS 121410]